ncbi:hypothetical protein LTR37_010128 [Vermiconidia calcicola]|uniref:Uncharacterized protein n=1 Tax=Vermiconidia calcicola TaxID=1690605 RepID=A0ACC3N5Q6_9PEZI|nr:hypothetical protein LTR37_010128 [Vermiconidia calcicola]
MATAAPTAEKSTDPQPYTILNMMEIGTQWTIGNFKRACGPADKQCTLTYNIKANDGSPTAKCSYQVTGSPASRASYSNVKCGAYTVSSSWSGQFGAGKGFTTMSVVKGNLIAYPSYTDKQLQGGTVVKPDQSYTPQNLPS